MEEQRDENMTQECKAAKKGLFRRLSIPKIRRKSKAQKAALQLDDQTPEETDRDSAINPFTDEQAGEVAEACSDEEQEQENDEEQEQENDEEQVGDVQEGKTRFSLRNKLKQRSDRKFHKKADKRVNKAMERAELERVKWLAKVAKEEEQDEEATRQRQLKWMKKGAERSKELMLQHLCAISIQASWRGCLARHQLEIGTADENKNEDEQEPSPAIDDSPTSTSTVPTSFQAPAPKAPTLVASSLMGLVKNQGALSP